MSWHTATTRAARHAARRLRHGHDTAAGPATQPAGGHDTALGAATIVVKRKQYVFYISVCKIYFFRTALVIYFLFFLV